MKKNGTVEFLRFVFCMAVLLFHVSTDIFGKDWQPATWGGVLRYGALSIEFFFLTSGYFMARSLSRLKDNSESLVADTWEFAWKKLKPILPYHIIFNAIMLLKMVLRHGSIEEVVRSLSSFLFLPTFGFNDGGWLLGAEWYIGYMLFAMILIYPFLRKYRTQVMNYIAPIVSLVLVGYLETQYHTVMGSDSLIVSMATILLGIAIYPLSEWIKSRMTMQSNKGMTIAVRIYPVIAIGAFLLYMATSLPTEMQPILVVILATGMAVTFAEEGVLSHGTVLNHPWVMWLGKISLPIYMAQNITRQIAIAFVKGRPVIIQYAIEIVFTLVAGIIAYHVISFALKRLASKRSTSITSA